jgi:hypothetical protein
MMSAKMILKLAALALGLATLHIATIPAHAAFEECGNIAVFCRGESSSGHCGYLPNEVCTSCYGIDGSVTPDVCANGGFNIHAME